MEPLLSVIISVYNGEAYIRRAAESLLRQPESQLIEILIVNDGSKDNSALICDRLAAEHENVHVIHKENGGVSSARNLGITYAKGKYAGFLDCDDWWEPDVFDHALAGDLRSENSADVFQFSFREVNGNVSLEKRYLLEDRTVLYETEGFGRYDWSHHSSFLFRRRLLLEREIRYLPCKVGEDGPMVEMALYHARSLQQSHRVLFSYWENRASVVHTTDALQALTEQCKGIEQKQAYYAKFGAATDAEKEKIWQILFSLPRICALKSYHSVKLFMEDQCMPILTRRPDIRFGRHLWSRAEAWKRCSFRYWLFQKLKTGLPLGLKHILLHLPGIRGLTSYLYTRYFRRFTPIKK